MLVGRVSTLTPARHLKTISDIALGVKTGVKHENGGLAGDLRNSKFPIKIRLKRLMGR
jgi:hypothetical protein